ncbi:MFS transporter, partial [Acinetobacter baumannii]
ILSGAAGASFTAATAYIADVSPPEKRAQNFGMVGGAFGLGFIIGPAIGGLLGQYGLRLPFWAAAVGCVLNLLYGRLVLPESLAPENR